jgi:hypothetical protein
MCMHIVIIMSCKLPSKPYNMMMMMISSMCMHHTLSMPRGDPGWH